jgi:hypothetical protein
MFGSAASYGRFAFDFGGASRRSCAEPDAASRSSRRSSTAASKACPFRFCGASVRSWRSSLPSCHGGEAGRSIALLDAGYAAIVDHIAGLLTRRGWIVELERSFNVFGERGAVDIVGWHPKRRSLLIVEVKTALMDLQAMLGSMSRKVRHVPGILERDRGWRRDHLGQLVVVAGTAGNRAVVDRHDALFAATFPSRSREARTWTSDPASDFSGLWFLSLSALGPDAATPRRRVRGPARPSRSLRADPLVRPRSSAD